MSKQGLNRTSRLEVTAGADPKSLPNKLFAFWKKEKGKDFEERLDLLKDIFETLRKQHDTHLTKKVLDFMIDRVAALLMQRVKINQQGGIVFISDREAQKAEPRHSAWRKEYELLLQLLDDERSRLAGEPKSDYRFRRTEGVFLSVAEQKKIHECQSNFDSLVSTIIQEKQSLADASEEMVQLAGVLLGLKKEYVLKHQVKVFERAIVNTITDLSFQIDNMREEIPEVAKTKEQLYGWVIALFRKVLESIGNKNEKKNTS